MFAKSLVTALVAVFAVGAQAQAAPDVEFFNQAGAGMTEITPMLSYGSYTTRSKGATTDTKRSGIGSFGNMFLTGDTGVEAEYGLNEMITLGGQLAFVSAETDTGAATKTKVSGLADPEVFLKGTTALEMGRLRWGGTMALGFQKSKTEANGDSNAANGGLALTPYIGYDMDAGPGFLGAALGYTFNLERTLDINGTEAKTTGGDVLALSGFYEYLLSDMTLGGALNFRSVGETTTKVAGVQAGTSKSFSPLGMSFYSRIPLAETAELLTGLDFDFSAGGDVYDKYTGFALNVGGRFTF